MSKWRYRCPKANPIENGNGHSMGQIRVRHTLSKQYYCEGCDKHYSKLWDMKEKKLVDRHDPQ